MQDYTGKGDELSLFELSDNGQTLTGITKKDVRYSALYVPEGVRTVCGAVFYKVNVKTVVLPDGVDIICSNAFDNCKNFKRIFIPKSVKTVGKNAFADCKQLKIYCEGEPQPDWIDRPDEKKVYYDDMTDAFNFHRSAGSFDDHYVVEHVEIIQNTYNPERRPIFTNVSREEFLRLAAEK